MKTGMNNRRKLMVATLVWVVAVTSAVTVAVTAFGGYWSIGGLFGGY